MVLPGISILYGSCREDGLILLLHQMCRLPMPIKPAMPLVITTPSYSESTSLFVTKGFIAVVPIRREPVTSGNPVFPGWYADPEIRIFKGQFWIYPTYWFAHFTFAVSNMRSCFVRLIKSGEEKASRNTCLLYDADIYSPGCTAWQNP